jgi:quinol monooxygenase YgiN
MSRVIFTISYEIQGDRRGEYLPLSQKMKDYILQKGGVVDYSVFEDKRKRNSFTEVFTFSSLDQYNGLDDEDEAMQNLMALLEPMLIGGKMKYTTLVEV